MKLVILLQHRFELWNPPAWFAERLRQEFPQVEVVHLATYKGAEEHLRDAEVLAAWSLRAEQFRAAQKLRWIHSPAAAVHAVLIPEVVASDVLVTNARGVHGPVVAEHALALIFALAKRLPACLRQQREHVWGQEQLWQERPRPRELAGATLGLVGVGSIGGEVARRAMALGMHVVIVREHPEQGCTLDGNSSLDTLTVLGADGLDQMLAQADFVVLAAPLTPRTQGLIGAAQLARMKPDAYLINVSRGPLIDDDALLDALRQQRIGGAALDVFAREPLPPESLYWDLPNVLITPHSAGFTEKLWQRHLQLFAENLRHYLRGEQLTALVDKQRGY